MTAVQAITVFSADAVLFPPTGIFDLPSLAGLISPDLEDIGHSIKPLGDFGNHPRVSHFVFESEGERKTQSNAVEVVALLIHFVRDEASSPPTTSATKHVLYVADSYGTAAEVLYRSMPLTTVSKKPVTKKQMAERVRNACKDTYTGLSSVYKGDRLAFMTLKQFNDKEAKAAAAAEVQ